MTSSKCARRIWIALALSIASAGSLHAQAIAGPHPSTVWQRPAAKLSSNPARVKGRDLSPKTRGLLIGAVIGGLAAGFLGNRLCHEIGSSGSGGWRSAGWLDRSDRSPR